MNIKKIMSRVCFAVVVFAVAVGAAGCNKSELDVSPMSESVSFPLKDQITLKIWCVNNLNSVTNYAEMGCFKELEKKTNIKLEFTHPVAGQGSEQFNMMIASGEFPDIIYNFDTYYSGGLRKGYEDGVIYELGELEKKYAPNLTALYEKYPQLLMMASTDEGLTFATPMIRGGNVVRTYKGLLLRKDYFEATGLPVPETIDEWEQVLTAMKNNGVAIPFSSRKDFFTSTVLPGAFETSFDYFLKDGKVVFGPYTDNFKAYMQTMSRWYNNELIDAEITQNDSKMIDSKVLNGQVGAIIGSTGGSVGGYISSMKNIDPNFDLIPVAYPTVNKGDKAYLIQRDPIVQNDHGASITKSCKHPAEAMAFLDYAYGKDGNLLYNFGVEGESYTLENGYPKFTDLITQNPDGLTMSKAGSKYALSFSAGPFVQDKRYGEQYYGTERQLESVKVWTKDIDKYKEMNPYLIGAPTPDEAAELAQIETEINTFVNETFTNVLMGKQSADDFDKFKQQLEQLNVKRAIEIHQNIYDRYVKKYPELKDAVDFDVSDFYVE